jgi:hypothetical protein
VSDRASHFGHVRGQTPDVAASARRGESMRNLRGAAAGDAVRLGHVWGQTPDVARRDV